MGKIKLSDFLIDCSSKEAKKLFSCIQGNILKSHGREKSRHVFFKIEHPNIGRKWLASFSKNHVTSALKQQEQTRTWLESNKTKHEIFYNLMFSYSGYEAMHIPENRRPKDSIFVHGMKYQKRLNVDLAKILKIDIPLPLTNPLDDPPVNSWEKPFQDDLHVLIVLASDPEIENELENQTNNIIKEAQENGLVYIHTEYGQVIKNKKDQVIEHFGHPDGVSQPIFLKKDYEKFLSNQNIKNKDDMAKYSDPRAPLKLVLLEDSLSNGNYDFGSFMVYRKLKQDVKEYHNKVEKLARDLSISNKQADQMVIGRDIDGIPMANLKTNPKDNIVPDNFDFSDDPKDKINVCPFQSHVRKSNPRSSESILDVLDNGVFQQRIRRIARRAVSYGPTPEELENSNYKDEAGLLFLCANADLGLQFVFMQTIWLNFKDFQKLNVGQDTILGQHHRRESNVIPQKWINSQGEEQKSLFNDVVEMKGGEYFFLPSMNTLYNLDKES